MTGAHNPILQLTRESMLKDSWKSERFPLGPVGALRLFLERGADPNQVVDLYGISLLHCFENFRNDRDLYRLLLKKSTKVPILAFRY